MRASFRRPPRSEEGPQSQTEGLGRHRLYERNISQEPATTQYSSVDSTVIGTDMPHLQPTMDPTARGSELGADHSQSHRSVAGQQQHLTSSKGKKSQELLGSTSGQSQSKRLKAEGGDISLTVSDMSHARAFADAATQSFDGATGPSVIPPATSDATIAPLPFARSQAAYWPRDWRGRFVKRNKVHSTQATTALDVTASCEDHGASDTEMPDADDLVEDPIARNWDGRGPFVAKPEEQTIEREQDPEEALLQEGLKWYYAGLESSSDYLVPLGVNDDILTANGARIAPQIVEANECTQTQVTDEHAQTPGLDTLLLLWRRAGNEDDQQDHSKSRGDTLGTKPIAPAEAGMSRPERIKAEPHEVCLTLLPKVEEDTLDKRTEYAPLWLPLTVATDSIVDPLLTVPDYQNDPSPATTQSAEASGEAYAHAGRKPWESIARYPAAMKGKHPPPTYEDMSKMRKARRKAAPPRYGVWAPPDTRFTPAYLSRVAAKVAPGIAAQLSAEFWAKVRRRTITIKRKPRDADESSAGTSAVEGDVEGGAKVSRRTTTVGSRPPVPKESSAGTSALVEGDKGKTKEEPVPLLTDQEYLTIMGVTCDDIRSRLTIKPTMLKPSWLTGPIIWQDSKNSVPDAAGESWVGFTLDDTTLMIKPMGESLRAMGEIQEDWEMAWPLATEEKKKKEAPREGSDVPKPDPSP